jgi:ribosomal subunit interface protein
MTMALHIRFRELAPLPSLEPEIRRRALKLAQWGADVQRCDVTVDSSTNAHRTGHPYRVRIEVHVPGRILVAGMHHDDTEIYAAVADAFDAMDRQLEDHVRLRRGQIKLHRGDAGAQGRGSEAP